MKKPATVMCPKCQGCGTVPVPAGKARVLEHVPRGAFGIRPIELLEMLQEEIGVRAIINRLEWLRRNGLVWRQKRSGLMHYGRMR